MNWLLREGNADQNPRLVVLRVNNTYGIFRAVESGLGIASLPDYLARESTKLEMVLPDLNVRTTDVYFTYPEELRHSKRIAVFRDFLLRKVAETRFLTARSAVLHTQCEACTCRMPVSNTSPLPISATRHRFRSGYRHEKFRLIAFETRILMIPRLPDVKPPV